MSSAPHPQPAVMAIVPVIVAAIAPLRDREPARIATTATMPATTTPAAMRSIIGVTRSA